MHLMNPDSRLFCRIFVEVKEILQLRLRALELEQFILPQNHIPHPLL